MRPTNYPNVVCSPMPSPLPSVASRRLFLKRCTAVELDMDATPETQIFGPRLDPGVAVRLPTAFSDGKWTILASTVVSVRS